MSASAPVPTITLHFDDGTLFATPNGGTARALGGSVLRFASTFPFRIEFATLTGSVSLPEQAASAITGDGFELNLKLPGAPPAGEAPSFKYTIKGDGPARGRVLDPIIIIDKRPGG